MSKPTEILVPTQVLVNLVAVVDNSFARGAIKGEEAFVVGAIRQEILNRIAESEQRASTSFANLATEEQKVPSQND